MLSFSGYLNVEAVPIKILSHLQKKINPKLVISELEKHPDYPSLLAVSDVLQNFDVENKAFKVPFEDLYKLPLPLAVQTASGEFAVIKKITGQHVWFSNEKWNNQKMKAEDFKQMFMGVVLVTEATGNETGKPKSVFNALPGNTRSIAIAFLLSLILGLTITIGADHFSLNWSFILLGLVNLGGFMTSILLLIQHIDNNNPLVRKLCDDSLKSNCTAILSSNAAKIFDWLSWSEIGFFYFAGSLIYLLCNFGSSKAFCLLGVFNIFCLPYSFYSIYYQARVAKQWCKLCLTVQLVLWLSFFAYLTNFINPLHAGIKLSNLLALIVCVLIPIAAWTLLKPLFLKAQELKTLRSQLREVKYNNDVFEKLLKTKPKFSTPDEKWSIVLGAKTPAHVITMASNPFCEPCANTHKVIKRLLKTNKELQVRIIFTTSNDPTDPRYDATRRLLEINQRSEKDVMEYELDAWYTSENKKYNWTATNLGSADEVSEIMERQKDWCKLANIEKTPTLFVNGYLLPEIYRIEDIKYLLQ